MAVKQDWSRREVLKATAAASLAPALMTDTAGAAHSAGSRSRADSPGE